MIIVFILGYVLIGILIQLVGRLIFKDETLKEGYIVYDDIMSNNIDDKTEIAIDVKLGMDEKREQEFNDVMYDPKYMAINILGWPVNIVLVVIYLIKMIKIFK